MVVTVFVGLNEPHVADELPGVQLHTTPKFLGSLVIVATRLVLPPAAIEAGGFVDSETDGVEDPEPELEPPPQATSPTATDKHSNRRINLPHVSMSQVVVRKLIALLRRK